MHDLYVTDILKVCMKKFNAEKSHDLYVTDILKMCMKKFNAEKIIFDKFAGF